MISKTHLSCRSTWMLMGAVGATFTVAITACGAADQADPPPVVEAPANAHRHLHGPVGVVVDAALHGAEVSGLQAVALRHIYESVRLDKAKRDRFHDEMKGSAIEILRIGDAENAHFDDASRRAAATMERHILETGRALQEVHATLDGRQRVAAAGVLRDRINRHFGQPDEIRRKEAFVRFTKYMAMTALQIAQLETLRDMLRDEAEQEGLHPTREELLSLVDAFEGAGFGDALDAFHARKLAIMHERFSMAWRHTNSVLSIFSDGQRVLLADLIDRGPMEVLFGEKTARVVPDTARR